MSKDFILDLLGDEWEDGDTFTEEEVHQMFHKGEVETTITKEGEFLVRFCPFCGMKLGGEC